jgi:DNA-binding NarL/FixJ family response regulator
VAPVAPASSAPHNLASSKEKGQRGKKIPVSGNAGPARLGKAGEHAAMGPTVRCLIVDDNAGFRSAARAALERGGIAVVGVAANRAEALRCHARLRPDVTLVDVDLGDESGFDLAEQLHRAGGPHPSAIVMISSHAEQDLAELIAVSPAIGFVSKMSLSAEAIRRLVDGPAVSGPPGT